MSVFGKGKGSRRNRGRDRNRNLKLGVELFEERMLLSAQTFDVTKTTDNGDNTNPINGSLRWAIQQAELAANAGSTIDFKITPATTPITIKLANSPNGALLPISRQTKIDGTTQSGFTNAPVVIIDGSALSAGTDGLVLTADGSTVTGLSLVGFSGAGIHVESKNDLITGNVIENGSGATPKGEGIWIDGAKGASGTTIGGTLSTAANVLGFNAAGISISGTSATNATILGNFIGTDSANNDLHNAVGISVGTSVGISGNTIGGTANGAFNTIAHNTGDAIDVDKGTGNPIRGNRIFANGGDIVLTNSGNNNQAQPTILAVASVPNLTTIDYQVTGTLGQTYTIDFYASTGSGGPAARYLGSATTAALTSTTQNFTAVLFPATAVANGQTVTATSTSTSNNTSEFAAGVGLSLPFDVTNTTDNVQGSFVGSLRQAILDANKDAAANPIITFHITTGLPVINLKDELIISVPLKIDGTSQPGVKIDGNHNFDGLTLDTNSDGSTITGLTITDFKNGIHIKSTKDVVTANRIGIDTDGTSAANGVGILIDGLNGGTGATIGGTTAADANSIGFNTSAGVSIVGTGTTGDLVIGNAIGADSGGNQFGNQIGVAVAASGNIIGGTAGNTIGSNILFGVSVTSGSKNTITRNNYTGTNGPTTPIPAFDIHLSGTANNSQDPPTLVSASYDSATRQLVLKAYATTTPTGQQVLQVYLNTAGQRTFVVASAPVTLSTNSHNPTKITINVPGTAPDLASGDSLIATVTDPTNGTSAFSGPVTVAGSNIVTVTDDTGAGSLRSAIDFANLHPGTTILFAIPGDGPYTITLGSTLKAITAANTMFDGTSEANLVPGAVVQIDGSGLGASSDGLVLKGDGATVTGLSFTGFSGADIRVESKKDLITGNTLENGASGSTKGEGILIDGDNGGSGATIGGTSSSAANTIGFNTTGISIGGTSATDTTIIGNYVGTDASGNDLGNRVGVAVATSGNTIGGTGAGAANFIGKNTTTGLSITGDDNLVEGDYVGTNASGAALGNPTGIGVSGQGNTIGGIGAGNTIGAATTAGIAITGDDTLVEGNLIGPSASLGNKIGISTTSTGNTIGGALATAANTIGFSSNEGVSIGGTGTTSNLIAGNYVGTNASGGKQANARGIVVSSGGNTIGGTTADANVVGNSSVTGIAISGTNNLVSDNYVGTDSAADKLTNQMGILVSGTSNTIGGTTADANVIGYSTTSGVSLSGASNIVSGNMVGLDSTGDSLTNDTGIAVGAGTNTIGGTAANRANTVGFSSTAAIAIAGAGATGNLVGFNFIGTDSSGGQHANDGVGVLVGTSGNTIDGNTIGKSGTSGISIGGTGATGNTVVANFIGINASGQALPNGVGISLGASDNTIGGAGVGNSIGHNTRYGVQVLSGNGNVISQDEYLGTNGPATPVQFNDINLLAGANNNQAAPTLLAASYDASTGDLVLQVYENAATAPGAQTLELYLSTASQRTFEKTASVTLSTDPNAPTEVDLNVPGLHAGETLIATLTDPTNGTSTFSNTVAILGPNVVTTVRDSGAGSLRAAINYINSLPDTIDVDQKTILFNIHSDPDNHTLQIPIGKDTGGSALPVITIAGAIVDGTSEADYIGDPAIRVQLNGVFVTKPEGSLDGLTLAPTAHDSSILGLEFVSFQHGAGIRIESTGDLIVGNYVGTDGNPAHSTIPANPSQGIPSSDAGNLYGILVDGASGGSGATISGNTVGFNTTGISIGGGATSGNLVIGNAIGVIAGKVIGNATGIAVSTSQNTIGGTLDLRAESSTTANTIGLGSRAGIDILAKDVSVLGNFVGTDRIGSDLGGAGAGIIVETDGETIGGEDIYTADPLNGALVISQMLGNVIGFSDSAGISIAGGSEGAGNTITGNYIGVDPLNPRLDLSNADGIKVASGTSNLIGGPSLFTSIVTYETSANVIGFSSVAGIEIDSDANTVQANYIGTGPDGYDLGNHDGIRIDGGSRNTIGGHLALKAIGGGDAGNVDLTSISGNIITSSTHDGIRIENTSATDPLAGNLVVGNYIGTNPDGDRLGNVNGVEITSSSYNTIGSSVGGLANLISANNGVGILIDVTGPSDYVPAVANSISANVVGAIGNSIFGTLGGVANGTGMNPDVTVPGNLTGIEIQGGAYLNIIGGPVAGSDYTVSPDTGAVASLSAVVNRIVGNELDGVLFDNLFPRADGRGTVAGSATISGTVAGNLISDNGHNGIDAYYSGPTTISGGITAKDNFIGTDIRGKTTSDPQTFDTIGNRLSGIQVSITGKVSIGGSMAVSGNVISGNGLSGIAATSASTVALPLQITDNLIGTDVSGTTVSTPQPGGVSLSMGNVLDGIRLSNVSGVTVGRLSSSTGPGLDLGRSGGNLIAGSLGRGIELDAGTSNVLIGNNLIGVVFGTYASSKTPDYNAVSSVDANGANAGNLADGVFIFKATTSQIQANLISGNRGYGIHVSGNGGQADLGLTIANNFIGTNQDGSQAVVGGLTPPLRPDLKLVGDGQGFGNGADGIFLDNARAVDIYANVISANRDSGVNVLDSVSIAISGNRIGTDASGQSTLGAPRGDFGNASDGVFLSQSSGNTIGGVSTGAFTGLRGTSNVIAGNHGSGVFVSGSANSDNARQNLIAGNMIGISTGDGGQVLVIPNAVSGVILSNASENTVGGTSNSVANVISGNALDGVLLVNNAIGNLIDYNRIGTDPAGVGAIPNSADGIFLLGSSSGGQSIPGVTFNAGPTRVTGNVIRRNVISGNNQNGIQIFGSGALGNTVVSNTVGLRADGAGLLINGGNKGNGIYLNSDGGGNQIGDVGQANVISGNGQSGVLIYGTSGAGGGDLVQGNRIGTDAAGSVALANGGNGVFIYGTSRNQVTLNQISGNAQAGVSIFSPATSAPASQNAIAGNWIGTNASGTGATGIDGNPLGNRSDGIDVFSGESNIIGRADLPNVISGNQGNGILINKVSIVSPDGNTVAGNYIGVTADGNSRLGNALDGVLVQGGTNNQIGVGSGNSIPGTSVPSTPSNVISANGGTGIEFSAGAPGNRVQGNYIGVGASGTGILGNGFAGVFVNNLGGSPSNELIGGPGGGEGNIISGSSSGFGVNLLGPAVADVASNTTVEGNLIGLDRNGNAAGNSIGVMIQNSAKNVIGGSAGNVISGNGKAGVEIVGLYSTQNMILNNEIGTTIGGGGRPGASRPLDWSDPASLQQYGVFINQPSPLLPGGALNNVVQQNVISGNLTGVAIIGIGSASGSNQGVPLGQNVIVANKIGTDLSGMAPNPNFQYGVYIENSAANTVGGGAGLGNLISANGVDGIEIFGGTPQRTASTSRANGAAAARNIILGNQIGVDARNNPSFTMGNGGSGQVPDGPFITLGEQTYGVVVIGSSSNVIGAPGMGNVIGGNVQAGVYITVRDFQNNNYSVPSKNAVNSNLIINNGVYGVYRYESPMNPVGIGRDKHANKFHGNTLNLADYLRGINGNTHLPTPRSRFHHRRHLHHHHPKVTHPNRHPARAAHGRHGSHAHHAVRAHHAALTHHLSRPRVPALFEHGVKTMVIKYIPTHHRHH